MPCSPCNYAFPYRFRPSSRFTCLFFNFLSSPRYSSLPLLGRDFLLGALVSKQKSEYVHACAYELKLITNFTLKLEVSKSLRLCLHRTIEGFHRRGEK